MKRVVVALFVVAGLTGVSSAYRGRAFGRGQSRRHDHPGGRDLLH